MKSARAQLGTLGLRPRKGLSQSFLEDRAIAAAIVRAARLDSQRDDVLEVGPGLGVLTQYLVRSARNVVAVELDPDLASWLRAEFGPRLTVHTADILAVDPSTFFANEFVVVANLPYHLSSPALRHLLQVGPPYTHRLIVMLQAEVAERITAQPGDLSALAVTLQVQASLALVRRVSKQAFYPRPKVDSAVVRIEPLTDPERQISRSEHAEFTRLVQAGFRQPRKTLANSLSDGLAIEKADAAHLLAAADIDPGRRPQALAVADWVRLFRVPRR